MQEEEDERKRALGEHSFFFSRRANTETQGCRTDPFLDVCDYAGVEEELGGKTDGAGQGPVAGGPEEADRVERGSRKERKEK
eukprot:5661304-Prorocentrum_lima.AAC.1